MIAGDECRGELLGQSRRGALTDAGRLAFDAHLAACASCRLAREVLADFDQVDVVDIRDGARVRALVDTARRLKAGSTAPGRPRSQRRLRAAAAAAALIVCGGSASAAVWLWRRPAPLPATVAQAPVGATVETTRPPSRAPVAAPAPIAALAETPAVAPPVARHRLAARAAVAPGDARASAAALLADAGRARGEGQIERAVSLYRRLQREFPGTPEALVSAVPLGRLLLDGGAARPALAAFDGYLRDAPGGPLVAEALYGKGRALELLGDGAQERQTWERLITDHAGSVYVPHARRRLAALR